MRALARPPIRRAARGGDRGRGRAAGALRLLPCGPRSRRGRARTATIPPARWRIPALLRALGFHQLAAHDAQSLVRLGLVRHPARPRPRRSSGCVVALREWQPRYLFPLLTAAHLRPLLLLQDPRLRRLLLRDAAVRARGAAAAAGLRRASLLTRLARAAGRAARRGRRRWPRCWPRCFLRDTLPIAAAPRVGGRGPLRGRRGAALRPPGRRDLRAAALHPPAVAAAVGRARRERAGAGALQPRPRPAAAPRARVAEPLPQHLLRPHLQHRPVRPVPAARRGAFLRRLRVGARLRPPAARARSSSPCASRSRAWCCRRSCRCPRCPRWTWAAPTTSRSPASTTRKAAATHTYRWTGSCASIYVPGGAAGRHRRPHRVRGTAAGDASRRSSA